MSRKALQTLKELFSLVAFVGWLGCFYGLFTPFDYFKWAVALLMIGAIGVGGVDMALKKMPPSNK
jgi:hypothetical protein